MLEGVGGDGGGWRGDLMSSEVGLLGGRECWDGLTVWAGGCCSCSGYRRCAVSFPMFAEKGVQYYLPAAGAALGLHFGLNDFLFCFTLCSL